ncbi:MAG: NAD(P)-binding domain-containing protein [Gammaproteobacteria bacterium]
MNHQIGFIGGGNMAQAIIAGLLKSGRSSSDILVSDPNPECRKALSSMGVTSFQDSSPVMAQADLVVLAVKPQIMDTVLAGLADSVKETQIIISIAAGITIPPPIERCEKSGRSRHAKHARIDRRRDVGLSIGLGAR